MTPTALLDTSPQRSVVNCDCLRSHDATHDLGETIAELAARLHAATYQLLVMLREFDAQAGWNTGFLSCAHWLHWRTGIDLGACREKVRVARALEALPLASASMEAGQLSYAKVRALTRVATPANERKLVDVALAGTAAHVERVVRGWRRVDAAEERSQADTRHLRRTLTTWVDDDGMVVIRGRLSPEVGALVQRALDAAADELFKSHRGAARGQDLAEDVTYAQRRADALGRIAEAALSADADERHPAGPRCQVVVHIDHGETGGVLETGSGPVRISAETSQRLACDASVVEMRHDLAGTTLDVGRRTRTVPSSIRRALEARDGTCRFPGCTSRRCDAHHVQHWVDGGVTSLHNLVMLCRRHHRAVHEGRFAVESASGGSFVFRGPDGAVLPTAPLPPAARAYGLIDVEIRPPAPWDGTRLNVGWAIDVLRGIP